MGNNRVKVEAVERVHGVTPKSVTLNILGTHIKFVLMRGVVCEASRVRYSRVYDAENYYIKREDYAQAVKQAATILKGG